MAGLHNDRASTAAMLSRLSRDVGGSMPVEESQVGKHMTDRRSPITDEKSETEVSSDGARLQFAPGTRRANQLKRDPAVDLTQLLSSDMDPIFFPGSN